ncbi:hypothetical protein G3P65_004706 [Vibrio parahaemolyticus]|nr:hypothetical protein [Vibrio parahaemolyticus]
MTARHKPKHQALQLQGLSFKVLIHDEIKPLFRHHLHDESQRLLHEDEL